MAAEKLVKGLNQLEQDAMTTIGYALPGLNDMDKGWFLGVADCLKMMQKADATQSANQ